MKTFFFFLLFLLNNATKTLVKNNNILEHFIWPEEAESKEDPTQCASPQSRPVCLCCDSRLFYRQTPFFPQRGFVLPRMRAVARQLQDIPGSYEAKTLARNAILLLLLLHSAVECLFFTLHIFVRWNGKRCEAFISSSEVLEAGLCSCRTKPDWRF